MRLAFRGTPHLLLLAAALIFTGSACSLTEPAASRPGISHREEQALVESYYWQRKFPLPTYTDAALRARMARSADPTLDADVAEGQASAMAVALATVGDERFARILARLPPPCSASCRQRHFLPLDAPLPLLSPDRVPP